MSFYFSHNLAFLCRIIILYIPFSMLTFETWITYWSHQLDDKRNCLPETACSNLIDVCKVRQGTNEAVHTWKLSSETERWLHVQTPRAGILWMWQILKPSVYYFFKLLWSSPKSEGNKMHINPDIWNYSLIHIHREILNCFLEQCTIRFSFEWNWYM